MKPVTESMLKRTNEVMRRIAELKIKAYGLDDTIDEYLEKCKAKEQDPRQP